MGVTSNREGDEGFDEVDVLDLKEEHLIDLLIDYK